MTPCANCGEPTVEVHMLVDDRELTMNAVVERVRKHGDLFAPVLDGGQKLAAALEQLRELTTDAAPPKRRPRRR